MYDQSSSDPAAVNSESFLSVLLAKLERTFPSVHLLSGKFCDEGRVVLVPPHCWSRCVTEPQSQHINE